MSGDGRKRLVAIVDCRMVSAHALQCDVGNRPALPRLKFPRALERRDGSHSSWNQQLARAVVKVRA